MSGLGLPGKFVLSPGQGADITYAEALLDGATPEVVIADRGYDKRALVERVEGMGAEAVIPTQRNRAVQREIDRALYRERNAVERFWSRAKQFRRVATRYEKTARNFLAFLQVASIMILLR